MQQVKYACEMNAVVVALISQTGPGEMSAFGMIFIHMQAAASKSTTLATKSFSLNVIKICNMQVP